MRCILLVCAASTSAQYAAAAAAGIDAADVTYRAAGKIAVERNLSAVLGDFSATVLDFGAKASCFCGLHDKPYEPSCCPVDDTPAFTAAIAASSSVLVPPGVYRIDGTIHLGGNKHLTLAGGASLLRTNLTACTDPVVVISGWFNTLVGRGRIQTANAAPRGVVAIGPPANPYSHVSNNEWNRLEGITIQGPGTSWSYATPARPEQNPRPALCSVHS